LTLLAASAALFASGHGAEGGGTDIFPRTVNFLIFAGILWYLLATPVKNFFNGRSAGIADQLNRVQEKLLETKTLKAEAEQRVEEAKVFAENLKETTKKEQKVLEEQIMKQYAADLTNLDKQNEALMELAQRSMVREVVGKVVGDVVTESAASLDKEKMAQIIMKKVA